MPALPSVLKVLYDGFDLCDPATSVSVTIIGPAPIILAMFFNTALDQQLAKFQPDNGRAPTDASVRRAMTIQLVINREWGLANNENPNQGAFIIDELTDLVEEAVLKEFEAIADRGGVLGAMETGYQRGKIQEESLYYEHQKQHDGSHPIIGVNTFRNPQGDVAPHVELARSTKEEKQSQIARLRAFQARHAAESGPMLARLKQAVIGDGKNGGNVFAVLVDAVRVCSLCQISGALYEVCGQYRRSM
jgi:methylmalonyl-CoA mutase